MLDSGCSRAIISADNHADRVDGTWSNDAKSYVQTAAGVIRSSGTVTAEVPQLGRIKDVLVMKNCPNMIGMGHVVQTLGYEFHWTPTDGPTLSRDGHVVPLEVVAGVPVIHAAVAKNIFQQDGFIGESLTYAKSKILKGLLHHKCLHDAVRGLLY